MTSYHVPLITTSSIAGFEQTKGLPPLPTVFTPPDYCSLKWYYDTETPGTVWSDALHYSDWNYCQPFSQNGVYTPGVCASGQEFKQVIKYVEDLNNGTTDTFYQGNCCSSGFSWVELTNNVPTCMSTFDASMTASVIISGSSSNSGLETSTVLPFSVTAIGAYIEILWHESDTAQFPESLAASLRVGMGMSPFTSSTSTSSSISQIPSATAMAADQMASSHGLSGGAIAGICITLILVVIILAILAHLSIRRRWNSKYSETSNPRENQDHGNGKSHFSRVSWIQKWQKGTKMPADSEPGTQQQIPEMDTGPSIYKEFGGGAWRSELPGGHSRNPSDTRSELQGSVGHCRKPSDGISELQGNPRHSRSASNGSQFDPRVSYHSGSTALSPVLMELEGSSTVHREPIAESREERKLELREVDNNERRDERICGCKSKI